MEVIVNVVILLSYNKSFKYGIIHKKIKLVIEV